MDDRNRSDYLHEVAWLASELTFQQVSHESICRAIGHTVSGEVVCGSNAYFTGAELN